MRRRFAGRGGRLYSSESLEVRHGAASGWGAAVLQGYGRGRLCGGVGVAAAGGAALRSWYLGAESCRRLIESRSCGYCRVLDSSKIPRFIVVSPLRMNNRDISSYSALFVPCRRRRQRRTAFLIGNEIILPGMGVRGSVVGVTPDK